MKYYSLLFLLFLTSCSKSILTYKQPKGAITITIPTQTPSLIFFSSTPDQEGEHQKTYLRFHKAFGDTYEFPIKSILTTDIVAFSNETTVYYNNKSNKKQGIILSSRNKAPVIEHDPKNYIKAYESYFGITFHDKIYYQERVKTIDVTNKKQVKEILETKFKITAAYADYLIQNSSTAHYNSVKKKKHICNVGTVYTYHYTDSLKSKTADYVSYTKYNQNHQYEKEVRKFNSGYNDETYYYYNNFGLLDSLITKRTSDGKTEKNTFLYIYRKNEYFTLNKEGNNIYLSARYILNNKLQCTKQQNFSRYSTEYNETEYKYDELGRLIESIRGDNRDVYEYEKKETEIYSTCKHFTGDNPYESKNTITRKGDFLYYFNEREGKTTLYSKAKMAKNDCAEKDYNYDLNKKLIGYTEYIYK